MLLLLFCFTNKKRGHKKKYCRKKADEKKEIHAFAVQFFQSSDQDNRWYLDSGAFSFASSFFCFLDIGCLFFSPFEIFSPLRSEASDQLLFDRSSF